MNNGEKLSVSIDRMARMLDTTEALSGEQVMQLVEFLRKHLPNIKTFAQDFEFADQLNNPRLAPALMASTAVRLYDRMTAPHAPLLAVRPPVEVLVDLGRFGRSAAGGGR